MGNSIIAIGIFMIVAGLLMNIIGKGNIPPLPGDILIKKENITLYIPIVTSIVVSVIITLLLHLFRK